MKKLHLILAAVLLLVGISACCTLMPGSENCKPTCFDNKLNQREVRVDCGGPCPPCEPSCSDGIQNQGETGVDCGGPCRKVCPATCDDGIQNQREAGVDCGGPCPPCSTVPTCMDNTQNQGETGVDCGGPCPACPTCSDNIQNQGEAMVDCGGPCPPCGTLPTCIDRIQNQGETGVDCGGPCPPCPPTCADGILNQGEREIDCGGPCPACPPTCFDNVQNQGETTVDCGGPCPECPTCNVNGLKDGNERGVDCGGDCPPCKIVVDKELMITDLAVIESNEAKNGGAFTFEHLIRNMARTSSNADAKELVLSMLQTWRTNQTVNTFTVPSRVSIDSEVINPWKAKDGQPGVSDANWNMNLANAPFRLTAIVNRIDLHEVNSDGSLVRAGEGRFVFCLFDQNTTRGEQFTLIFEYNLPGETLADLEAWANKWHALGEFNDFGPGYVAALKSVTEGFVGRGVMPSGVNGNAISQVRTNEVELGLKLGLAWELREFVLDNGTSVLKPTTVKQTPDNSFDEGKVNAQVLKDFIDANATAISNIEHVVPETFNGTPMLAGNSITAGGDFVWKVPGADANLVSIFSKETCNGCHGGSTDTGPFPPPLPDGLSCGGNEAFTHIKPRCAGEATTLSNFLTEPGGDLEIRENIMQFLLDEAASKKGVKPKLSPAEIKAEKTRKKAVQKLIIQRKNRTH